MRLSSMWRTWMLTAGVAFGMLQAVAVLAQDLSNYETPRYQPRPPTTVDKNYGLPSFGMQGSELPQQKTMAPEKAPDPSVVPDFFADAAETAVPKVPGAPALAKDAETPSYTTSDGSTMAATSAMTDDSDTSSDDTAEAHKVQQR